MLNNYDKIAGHYDTLSRLVFFKSQVNAQINQLRYIQENSHILIVGGGTGWILEELAKIYSSGLKIVYVEISAKMIALSQKRSYKNNHVEFVNMGIEDFKTDVLFDVILTPFLFDNFAEQRAAKVFAQLNEYLKRDGLWFLVDFSLNKINGNWWKWLLLRSMYSFFKLLGIVEAHQLIDMNPYFFKANYLIVDERLYYGSFIKATIFRKIKMTLI
ncbi:MULTISPECIES: class I SAM-dependent methyltransferase [unclassified Pedobacter]|uniref:class I SAM-dependent methyltransferase n=1 Tax=unclassified Pedobacter TaxID=2628915 RepID=UPI001D697055|nr:MULTISPECIES: class I SAM-dependent methyltransferase [unclassified Pedobacter]CAH0241380.1 Ubiquinone/menaquinone biosynthesis C-methyltransferase UbiE [Pedobacter sp. Bi36]CAH0267389.1 Ubiquinone/menaquinone biosynthesis C-methyltransferase UbiE [Pedobacter sp. Bi126]